MFTILSRRPAIYLRKRGIPAVRWIYDMWHSKFRVAFEVPCLHGELSFHTIGRGV